MFLGITGTPRDYAWGSRTAIPELLGTAPTDAPEAEYWLGTHASAPSVVATADRSGGPARLSDWTTLSFLLKVLAADAPLSLQAHPTTAQARAGFERENRLGIPIDAPNRNYRDAMHKPELIYALKADFAALCGFRPVAATRELLATLGPDPLLEDLRGRLVDDGALRAVFRWLVSRSPGVEELVARVVSLAAGVPGPEFAMVGELAMAYPGDPGIVIALLLNRVELQPGQALYLPAGNIHAYLKGVGVELMAASDNVLRGGLTPKHIDVPELLSVLDFSPTPVPYLEPSRPSVGVELFQPDVPDFELAVIDASVGPARFSPRAEAILLCLEGECRVTGSGGERRMNSGDSLYATTDEGELVFDGTGTVFVATSNRSQD